MKLGLDSADIETAHTLAMNIVRERIDRQEHKPMAKLLSSKDLPLRSGQMLLKSGTSTAGLTPHQIHSGSLVDLPMTSVSGINPSIRSTLKIPQLSVSNRNLPLVTKDFRSKPTSVNRVSLLEKRSLSNNNHQNNNFDRNSGLPIITTV
jgi:hypothetical protein